MTVEIPKARLIKNIGIRPHNPPYSYLTGMIQNNERDGQLGILMLKPGCFSVSNWNTTIQDRAEELISLHGQDVIATSCTTLTRKQVHELYGKIFDSNVTAATDRLNKLRILLEDYLSNCVFTYLVSGSNSLENLEIIKRALRQDVPRIGDWDVKNRVHVPSQDELAKNIDILFKRTNCLACLKQKNE